MPKEKIMQPVTEMGTTPPSIEQSGILVLDGSPSMEEEDAIKKIEGKDIKTTRADAVSVGVKGLIETLKKSSRRQDFWLSLIAYDHEPEVRNLPERVVDIDIESWNTNPLRSREGGTAIGDALEKAWDVGEEFLRGEVEGGLHRSVVILLMSDGQNTTGKDPKEVASKIKERLEEIAREKGREVGRICCVPFGKEADKSTLKEIASENLKDEGTGRWFKVINDAEELRQYFETSVKAPMGKKV